MSSDFTAHAKAILIGEHAVVYGADALSVPLTSLTLTALVEADPAGPTLNTDGYCGDFDEAPQLFSGIRFLFTELVEKPGRDTRVRLTFDSHIPMARGLGSSAASALATIRALNSYYGLNLSEPEIISLGNRAEDIVHGKASGLDLQTVNSDQLVSFNKESGFTHIPGNLDAWLVIADTGVEGSTKEAVAMVRDQRDSSPLMRHRLDELGTLSRRAKQAWKQKDSLQLGTIFDAAQEILVSFGISTSTIDKLVDVARDAGALGAKLSGSGLGGVVIALANTRELAHNVAQALRPHAHGVWVEQL